LIQFCFGVQQTTTKCLVYNKEDVLEKMFSFLFVFESFLRESFFCKLRAAI